MIKSFNFWNLYLHDNQCYLGRLVVVHKNETPTDLFDLGQNELQELYLIVNQSKRALKALFSPDRMNYASLGNVYPILHVHIIPRYKNPRVYGEICFTDKNWGKNYAPYDKEFRIPNHLLDQLKEDIRRELP